MRRPALLLLTPTLVAGIPQAPRFTATDAVKAEWERRLPAMSEADLARLPRADRARWDRARLRIGRPGTPDLLPPELANPTAELWEAKAREAKTPEARFSALFFLNRFKSSKALRALDGLRAEDATSWPKHLHLEAGIATARLNGGEVSAELQGFLDALQKAGKVDPVRAQAARLRLVMGGKEKELLPAVKATPGAVLSLIDAWNRSPKPKDLNWSQAFSSKARLTSSLYPTFLEGTEWKGSNNSKPLAMDRAKQLDTLTWVRFAEAKPASLQEDLAPYFANHWRPDGDPVFRFWTLPLIEAFPKAWAVEKGKELTTHLRDLDLGNLLAPLRKVDTQQADDLRIRLLNGPNGIARSAAIEDLPECPAEGVLKSVTDLTWKDMDFEPQQTLIQSYGRWKLPAERQQALLRPWLQHPNWSCRFEAYKALVKLDPATAWPEAPEPTARERAILKEAGRLAEAAKPVRLRIIFSGRRRVTLRLDPTVAPINVANLVLLARKGFFDGRRVPRVVPDFVVQMGSPYDTMDGGPGYTVRCENSLNFYGPGSVGMALSGKDTGGSQFFITTNATPHLTGKYTRMGEVEDLDRALPILDDLELGAKIERIEVLK